MTQALFRIGGVYRAREGSVVRLEEPAGPVIGRAMGVAHVLKVGPFVDCIDGFRFLDTGEDVEITDYEPANLIPGELHLFNGQWLQVEEKAEQPRSPYFAEALRSHTLKPVLAPIPEDMVAPDDGWLDDWMSDSANAAMIARDGPQITRPAPPPVAQEATSHAPLAGLTVLMERDHRFGLGR